MEPRSSSSHRGASASSLTLDRRISKDGCQWRVGDQAILNVAPNITALSAPKFLTDAVTVVGTIKAIRPHADDPQVHYCFFETVKVYPYSVLHGTRIPPHSCKKTEKGELSLGDTAIYGHERFSYRFDGWYEATPGRRLLPLPNNFAAVGGAAARAAMTPPATSPSRSRSRSPQQQQQQQSASVEQSAEVAVPRRTRSQSKTPSGEKLTPRKGHEDTAEQPNPGERNYIVGTNEWDSDDPLSSFADLRYYGYSIDPWFRAPFASMEALAATYPRTKTAAWSMYICHRCLAPVCGVRMLEEHMLNYCTVTKPPGTTVYKQPYPPLPSSDGNTQRGANIASSAARRGFLRVRFVDGAKDMTYCYNLSMLARCFVESKSLECDVDIYEFYIVTLPQLALPFDEGDTNASDHHGGGGGGGGGQNGVDGAAGNGDQGRGGELAPLRVRMQMYDAAQWQSGEVVVGYFCRPKHSKDLSLCIISVFPPFQRLGLGSIIMRVAFHLAYLRQSLCGCDEFCGRAGGKVGEPFSHAGHGLVYSVILRWAAEAMAAIRAEKMRSLDCPSTAVALPPTLSPQHPVCGVTKDDAIDVDGEEEEGNDEATTTADSTSAAVSPVAKGPSKRGSTKLSASSSPAASRRTRRGNTDGGGHGGAGRGGRRATSAGAPEATVTLREVLQYCKGLHHADLLGALHWQQRLVYVPSSGGSGRSAGVATLSAPPPPASPSAATQPPASSPTSRRVAAQSSAAVAASATAAALAHAAGFTFGVIYDSSDAQRPEKITFHERYILHEDGFGKLHDESRIELTRFNNTVGKVDANGAPHADPLTSKAGPPQNLTPLFQRFIHFWPSATPSASATQMTPAQ